MKRSASNFIIDLISFINLLGLIFTGFIIKFILPPGTGGLGRELHGGLGRGFSGYGIPLEAKSLWSRTRHEWGDIHFDLAVLFIALMLLHIIMHWAWIKNYVKSIFRAKTTQTNITDQP